MTPPIPAPPLSAAPFRTPDPLGRPLDLAATVADDPSPSFTPGDDDAIRSYYVAHGYVVVRGVVPLDRCQAANDAFDAEVKPDPRPHYRLSGRPEHHELTAAGFMRDGIRDVQSIDPRRAPTMRAAGTAAVTDPTLTALITSVLGEPGTVVQTMYFEGNPATQPHQDTYYLDADDTGRMVAAWIATEDIAPGAGRFYVADGSHRAELPRNQGEFAITDHHDR
ncbi:MAG TPA: phytanoyl-CoA dioxygenase family protein, partial [Acidimicrobiales bacterium]